MDTEHIFWITSRAAGIVALLASTAGVTLGLLMSGRLVRGRTAQLRVSHEALSLATIAALVIHAGALLGDSYLSPSLADVTIPFVSGYQRVWTTTGIVAGWMLIVLGLSYYARGKIGVARWRTLHRFTALAWLLGVLHGLFEGTDAGTASFLLSAAAAVPPAAVLLTARLAAQRRRRRAHERGGGRAVRLLRRRLRGPRRWTGSGNARGLRAGPPARLARPLHALHGHQRAGKVERRRARGAPGRQGRGAQRPGRPA